MHTFLSSVKYGHNTEERWMLQVKVRFGLSSEITHRLNTEAGFGDGLAGLAIKIFGQCGWALPTNSCLESQLVRHLECLAQCQDDLISLVLHHTNKYMKIYKKQKSYMTHNTSLSASFFRARQGWCRTLTTSKAVKTWQWFWLDFRSLVM